MDWIELFKLIGITSAFQIGLLIVIGFFGKKFFEYLLSESIEIKKQELSITLEKHKSELDILKSESNVKFSALHLKRTKIIELLYQKIIKLNGAMFELTAQIKGIKENFEEEEKQRLIKVDQSFQEFVQYYLNHKIYFSLESCDLIEKLKNSYFQSAWDYSSVERLQNIGIKNYKHLHPFYEKAEKASEYFRNDIQEILKVLETDFRKLLGV